MTAVHDHPATSLRVGFVTGSTSWLRKQGLRAKRLKMRLDGVVYPDVYSIPYLFTDTFQYLRDGERIAPGRFDLVLSELNRSERQLEHLASLVDQGDPPLAVIPGPPELLASVLTQRKLDLVKHVLKGARHVWAYSPEVKRFCDGLMGNDRTVVIPWPFDGDSVRRLTPRPPERRSSRVRVLLNVPLRFAGTDRNSPFLLKSLVLDALGSMPAGTGARFSFHTFAYTAEDRERFDGSGYRHGWPIHLERKRGYVPFVRMLARCDAVINLTASGILGRITFLAAALGKPGVFSDNAELNRSLYPTSVHDPMDASSLRPAVRELLEGLASGVPGPRFSPCEAAVASVGDFEGNRRRMRAILGSGPLVDEPVVAQHCIG